MQFVVERNSFLKDLSRVTGVIEPRNTIPICGNVRIDAGADCLMMRATNLSMEAETSCDASVTQQGLITANGKLLTDFVKRCVDGSQISFTLDQKAGRLRLVSGRSRSVLPVLPADDFPVFPRPGGDALRSFAMPSAMLKSMLDRVAFAVSSDEHKPVLQGVFVHQLGGDQIVLVGTDSYRISCISCDLPSGADGLTGVILPKPFVNELKRLLPSNGDAKLDLSEDFVSVSVDDLCITSNLMGGTYPDYQRAMPLKSGTQVSVNREDMIRSIQRVAIVTDPNNLGIQIIITPNEIRIAAESKTHGACFDAIDADGNGEVELGANHRYLLDVLGAFDCDRICINFNSGETPLRITDADDPNSDNCMALMPMRIPAITEERNAA